MCIYSRFKVGFVLNVVTWIWVGRVVFVIRVGSEVRGVEMEGLVFFSFLELELGLIGV